MAPRSNVLLVVLMATLLVCTVSARQMPTLAAAGPTDLATTTHTTRRLLQKAEPKEPNPAKAASVDETAAKRFAIVVERGQKKD